MTTVSSSYLLARHAFIVAARDLQPHANETEYPHDHWVAAMSAAVSALDMPDICDRCADSEPPDLTSRYPLNHLRGGTWAYECHACKHRWTCTWGQDANRYEVREVLPKGTSFYALVVESDGNYPSAPLLCDAWRELCTVLDQVAAADTPTLTAPELAKSVAEVVGCAPKTVRELIRTAVKSGTLYQENVGTPPTRVSYITREAPMLYMLAKSPRG